MKKAIFTVILNNYDRLQKAPQFDGWDCYLITDQAPSDPKGWKVIEIKEEGDTQKLSRKYKLLSHRYLSDYDLHCYIDGNGVLRSAPPAKPLFISHQYRTTVKDECKRCIQLGKDSAEIIMEQFSHYKSEGFPDKGGLTCHGLFVRPNNEKYNDLFEQWYEEIEKWSYRDQLSFPYVVWKNNFALPVQRFIVSKNLIKYRTHQDRKDDFNVHYITPGRPDLLYGRAVNDLIKNLPENDWICLRDIDTLVLDHKTLFQQLKDIIKAHGSTFDLMGAITNDIGLKWQLHNGKINKSFDVEEHYKINQSLIKKYYDHVTPDGNNHVAGFFMLFSKKIWEKAGKFPEPISVNGQFFDYLFSKQVQKVGGKIGIAQGVYLYHFKRYGKNPRDVRHLMNEFSN